MKAEAFSNKAWEHYWSTHGPSLLTTGWMTAYPHISLEKLQSVCSLEYLSHDLEQLILDNSTMAEGGHVTNGKMPAGSGSDSTEEGTRITTGHTSEEMNVTSSSSCDATVGKDHQTSSHTSSFNDKMAVTSKSNTDPTQLHNKLECAKSCDECMTGSCDTEIEKEEKEGAVPSDDVIMTMWSEHYNSYYWYCYQTFCQQTVEERGGEGRGDVLVMEEDVCEEMAEEKEEEEAVCDEERGERGVEMPMEERVGREDKVVDEGGVSLMEEELEEGEVVEEEEEAGCGEEVTRGVDIIEGGRVECDGDGCGDGGIEAEESSTPDHHHQRSRQEEEQEARLELILGLYYCMIEQSSSPSPLSFLETLSVASGSLSSVMS